MVIYTVGLPACHLFRELLRRPAVETSPADTPRRFPGPRDRAAGSDDLELVFPAEPGRIGERGLFGARLAEYVAEPVDAGAGGVGGDRPDRPGAVVGPPGEGLGGQPA